ncbi:hypothetical protein A5893_03070 [Pedobacter psychrophilus]|uniref:Uncharacterized protein n=1 Tax=Pedobacter psychrophilus TaxID=1826909 RepID=A0A179DM37_9SPHI|nr:hypothetical protein [Pedobacter psychrophilus]OAQ42111.1 hypothetical protein A5893_03070 [Pedobacter psychrophilus]
MANDKNISYFNFPIEIIKDAIDDIHKTCDNIISYSIYNLFLKLEFGDDEVKIKHVFDYLGINNPNWKSSLERAKELFSEINNHRVKTGIKRDLAFEFRDQFKSDFDIALFVAYCALRSILGSKPYHKCGNDFLLARMAGFAKVDELDEGIPDRIKKYSNRYQLDKIKKELERSWGLKYYSQQTRGFYFSFDISFESLVMQAELKRKKYLDKKANEERMQIIKSVKQNLK